MSQQEKISELTTQYMSNIMEHAESVRVFVTYRHDGTTRAHSNGLGNFYAQYGQIREWLIEEERSMQIDTEQRRQQ